MEHATEMWGSKKNPFACLEQCIALGCTKLKVEPLKLIAQVKNWRKLGTRGVMSRRETRLCSCRGSFIRWWVMRGKEGRAIKSSHSQVNAKRKGNRGKRQQWGKKPMESWRRTGPTWNKGDGLAIKIGHPFEKSKSNKELNESEKK